MSTFTQRPFHCPACDYCEVHTTVVGVNASRSPHLREQVLSGLLHRFICKSCQVAYLADEKFSYIDFDRKQWIFVYPVQDELGWADLERESREVFERTLTGPHVPPIAIALGRGLRIRAVFGLPALREKLLCWDADLDDTLLEVVKLEMMRSIPELSLDIEHRPRLTAISDDELCFSVAWPPGTDRSETDTIAIPKPAYQDLASNPVDYAAVITELRAGPYVDVGRLLLPT